MDFGQGFDSPHFHQFKEKTLISILFSFKGTGCGLGFRGKADGESCPPCSLLCNVFLPTVFFCRLDAVHDSNITIDDSDILFCGSRVFGALFAYLNA